MSTASKRNDFQLPEVDGVLLEAIPNLSTDSADLVDSVRVRMSAGSDGRSDVGNSKGAAVGRAVLLDVHFDTDHARSVWTLAGDPPGIVAMIDRLVAYSLDGIDLRRHAGEHPRMGAIDVAPFVPLAGGETASRWALWAARRFAEDLWFDFGIPSYFYGKAATRPDRAALPRTRKPFENLAGEIARGWLPDVGDPIVHEKWGAAAVGVRGPLVAFNVVLNTGEMAPARRIATEIRRMRAGGSLPGVQAKAFYLKSRGRSQVSMNLTRPAEAGVEAAFQAVLSSADRDGVGVEGAEVVGLAPAAALEGSSRRLLELCPDLEEHSLEDRLRRIGLPLRGLAPSQFVDDRA